ncbi:hypothetical protein LRB91_04995, partial [Leclercia adecarboxylata]|uniref:hypothetical protein n=1 Tax=Leclercia adecarboxylata TaxID=83655 RepID=UPI0022B7908F
LNQRICNKAYKEKGFRVRCMPGLAMKDNRSQQALMPGPLIVYCNCWNYLCLEKLSDTIAAQPVLR